MSEDCLMKTYGRFDVTFDKGLGSKLYDINGTEYIDFVSGVAVNCLGHSHPVIIKAIQDQSNKLIHVSNYYYNTTHTLLAKKLIENSDHESVFFCNSGTEAIEGALKLARKYGKLKGDKSTILYMENSFHGRSMGALSVTGQGKYQEAFSPLIGGVQKIPFNDLKALREAFTTDVCGVIVEPIQGEGGVIPINMDFIKEIRELCTENDALLIYDEVQCGIGRLGSLFAYKQFGVIPDVIALAKGLGGGFPIGAVIANKKASTVLQPGDHGSTFGGNPLACAVSLAVITELVDNKIIDTIDERSSYTFEKLEILKKKYPIIKEIRGMGFLIGVEIDFDTKEFMKKCLEKKLLLISAGPRVIRFLPPLNVTKEELDEALHVFTLVLEEIC
ncbi:MAG: aspartate aminotransferase family protein [Clostridiaceae bacterium]|nr:aspartate aminotransferase family protein [Clostridiaceae bacterium]